MRSIPESATILIADDDESNRYILRRILEGAGYSVVEAPTAAETVRRVYDPALSPALLILDVNLPDGNGYELCRKFKADPRLNLLPILQMSAVFTKDSDRVQGLECGADSYLVQPVDSAVLIATVRALLRIGTFEHEREVLLERELQAHREAELEKQKLHSIFMQAPAAIWILMGADHVFELVNPPALALLGGRSVIGKKLRDAIPEYETQGYFELMDSVFKTGEAHSLKERPSRLKQADGSFSYRFFNFAYQPWKDAQGKVAGILTFAVDVTDQVLARQQIETLAANLKIALQVRTSFIAIASHELRTPLTSLSIYCQMAMRDLERNDIALFTPERIRRLITLTNTQIDRLNVLVEDMLDVSWIGTGKVALKLEPVDLREVVREIIERYYPLFDISGGKLTLIAKNSVIGNWDRHRIEQTVINLLSNANKYGRGKPVTVTVTEHLGVATLKVEDHGLGIDPGKHALIFEQFERAVTSNNISGFGLGLFIVRNIVTQHQGTIRVESVLGEGSTFTVELPQNVVSNVKVS